jgi:hypothetical protein
LFVDASKMCFMSSSFVIVFTYCLSLLIIFLSFLSITDRSTVEIINYNYDFISPLNSGSLKVGTQICGIIVSSHLLDFKKTSCLDT